MQVSRKLIFCAMIAFGAFPSVAKDREEPKFGEGYAEVTFQKGYAKAFGTGAFQIYSSSSDGACVKVNKLAVFHAFTGKKKTKAMKAGEQIMVFSAINYVNSNFENQYGRGICMNKILFTPKSFGRYSVIQTSNAANCEIAITDLDTGSVTKQTDAMDPKSCTG